MVKSCHRCGGLYATEHLESFAGTPCRCGIRLPESVFAENPVRPQIHRVESVDCDAGKVGRPLVVMVQVQVL